MALADFSQYGMVFDMSDTSVDDKPTPPVPGQNRPAGKGAGRAVVAPQKNNPARQELAGPLEGLTKAEKHIGDKIKRLEAARSKAREKFRQATKLKTTPEEESQAVISAINEQAWYEEKRIEAELCNQESAEEEKNRNQIVEGAVAEAERRLRTQNANAIYPSKKGRKLPKVFLKLPVHFDYKKKILIDSAGQPSEKLPLFFIDVICAWFEKDPLNRNKPKLELTYQEIKDAYFTAKGEKNAPKGATDADIDFRVKLWHEKHPKAAEKGPEYYATMLFARAFTRLLTEKYTIGKDKLFINDEKAQKYKVNIHGWLMSRPIINHAEATKMLLLKSQKEAAGEGSGDRQ
jgi:hypothetical protein